MNKTAKIGISAVTGLLLVAVLFLVFLFDPEKHLFFPQCPFLLTTGWECPGCGSQRAIHHLLHLHVGTAWRYNAFMILALPYILLGFFLEYMGGNKRHPRLEKIFFGRWSAVVLLVVIIAYWILRNLL